MKLIRLDIDGGTAWETLVDSEDSRWPDPLPPTIENPQASPVALLAEIEDDQGERQLYRYTLLHGGAI